MRLFMQHSVQISLNLDKRIQQFKLQRSLFQVNMQLRIEYSRITNQTLYRFRQQFKRFSGECQLPTQY